MKFKKIISTTVIAAVITGIATIPAAFAAEKVIFDDTFNNTFAADSLDVNWWGKPTSDSKYNEGKKWASDWGCTGWFADSDDGTLIVQSRTGSKSKESGIKKLVVADSLPQGSSLVYTADFRTASQPAQSSTETWLRIEDSDKTAHNLFMYRDSPAEKPEIGFASTTAWPFTPKAFDRDPDDMSLEYNKDYRLVITLTPNQNDTCRFVADLYSEGEKLATGIVNEWNTFTPDKIRNIYNVAINVTANNANTIYEPSLYFKHISIKSVYPDVKPSAKLYPDDNSADVPPNTECYMQFEQAVNDISADNVSITGGAAVDSVIMQDGGKKALINLSGLSANTAYTVSVKNVSAVGSQSVFDYSWSFTTGSGVSFTKPYFGKNTNMLSQNFKNFDISGVVSNTDSAYENGEAWGTNDLSDVGVCYGVNDDGFLFAKGRLSHGQTDANILSGKFAPVSDGRSLNINAVVRLNEYAFDQTDVSLRLASSTDSTNNYTLLRLNQLWNGMELSALTKNQNPGAWINDNGTGSIIFKRGYWHLNDDNVGLGGSVNLNVTLSPDTDNADNYTLSVKIIGSQQHAVSKVISKSDAMALDTFAIYSSSNNVSSGCKDFMGIGSLSIDESDSESKMKPGDNVAYIDYTNLDSNQVFDTDILIVERKPGAESEYGEIQNITVISKKDLSGESGIIECPFELKDIDSTVDIFVLNSVDGGILLSDAASVSAD